MAKKPEPAPRPRAELIEQGGGKWKIQLKDFGAFRDQLGPDVVNAFCRCFVHADRLQSLTSFAYVSEKYHGKDSVAFTRNLHTMVWFTVGTLRELAFAIKDLRSSLVKRGLLDVNSAPWVKLREVEDRWDGEAFFREKRNTIAFHVDKDVVEAGLEVLVRDEKQDEVFLSQGDGKHADSTSLTLGLQALFNGTGMDLDQYRTFAGKVGDDHGIGTQIQEAFILAVNAAGIPFGEGH